MKKLILICTIFLGIIANAQNYELSTLRIGGLKIFMQKAEAEKITNKKISIADSWENKTKVKYYGQEIELLVYDNYVSENEPKISTIQYLSTKSASFRTKSNIGVGSTKEQVLNAYKNYPNYSVNQSWDENDPKNTSFFRLIDNDANTELSFKIINNIIVEATIYINEGC